MPVGRSFLVYLEKIVSQLGFGSVAQGRELFHMISHPELQGCFQCAQNASPSSLVHVLVEVRVLQAAARLQDPASGRQM